MAASQKLALRSAEVDSDSFQRVVTVSEIVEKYREWVSEDKYIILNRVKMKKYKIRDSRRNKPLIVEFPVESDYFALKCSKRGNDVYRQRVYRRFKGLASIVEKKSFFNPKDRKQNKKTRALFVTLTYETKRCSFDNAWNNIGIEFNRFMSHVRKKFGKVSSCRVFEAFTNGHPHIHCVLLFEEKEFKVFRDSKGKFRIREKETIESGWHSYVDIKAMGSLGWGFNYLKKYLLKSIDKENKDTKSLKTLALGWFFKKRAFSVSGKFKKLLADLIKTKHNSNQKTTQITLDGEKVQDYIYFVLGFVPADVVRLKNKAWFSKLDNEQINSIEQFLSFKK